MNTNNKRIRVENWLTKYKRYFNISEIDRYVKLDGKINRFLSENRKINDEGINKIFRFLKRFIEFKFRKKFLRDDVEKWLTKNQKFINKRSIDRDLDLKEAVRHFLYSNRSINETRIKRLSTFLKKLSQF